jgi:hypothetical protein
LVAVELKIGKFLPEYIGKMQFYLAALDDKVKQPDENSSIGIILCKSKNKTIVEYALRESNKPIGFTTSQLCRSRFSNASSRLPCRQSIYSLSLANQSGAKHFAMGMP